MATTLLSKGQIVEVSKTIAKKVYFQYGVIAGLKFSDYRPIYVVRSAASNGMRLEADVPAEQVTPKLLEEVTL